MDDERLIGTNGTVGGGDIIREYRCRGGGGWGGREESVRGGGYGDSMRGTPGALSFGRRRSTRRKHVDL